MATEPPARAAPLPPTQALPSSQALSPAIRRAREQLEQGRAGIRARHRAGAGGQEIVRAISALTDGVIAELFQALCAEMVGVPTIPLALVATGGYGRRELSPRSDVDLLALLPEASVRGYAEAALVAERLHRALWDAGLEAGFAARTLAQSMQIAHDDHTVRTALLDCRLLAGDAALYRSLEKAAVVELESKRIEAFIRDKLEEHQERRKRFGGSIWLLEPHLKQGKGGLRDLQCALWIARARHKVAGLGEAGERGLLPAREVDAARSARDWLWRLRNELHESTGRRDDRLTFDNQKKIAQAFGYPDTEHELGVERLMRETYTALQEIARASDALIDRCAVEEPPRSSAFASLPAFAGALLGRRAQPRAIDAAFSLWQGRIAVADRETFARRPADLVRLFAVAEALDVPIHSSARDLLVQELARLGPELARDREAHFECWQIFTRDGSAGTQLFAMHELGVLGALFPELQRLRARAQHSLYHVYTVDTHTVFALQRLCRLRAGALDEEEPELTRIARAQERPLALMLGLLFHDLGKGLGGDHSLRGGELVRGYAERVALDPTDAADVEWLVLQHLTMSYLSQRRDLEDVELIEAFAANCATVERLEMLYLLTYADMASVSPENWNSWKAGLLRMLYEKARAVLLAEGMDAPGHVRSLEARRERLIAQIAPLLDDAETASARARPDRPPPSGAPPRSDAHALAGEFVRAAPERYLSTVRAADAARHLELWLDARRSGFASELRLRESGEAEVTLLAPDRPGLLALFSAALAAAGIDILTAEVHSLEGGLALDRFLVREPGGGAPAAGRWESALGDLRRLLAGGEESARLVERRLRRSAYASAQPAVATRVRLDNRSSQQFTVLDVIAQDRPGLLFAIADALRGAGASIELARIATEGNRAADAFYLRDARAGGGKLEAEERGAAVLQAVREAIEAMPI